MIASVLAHARLDSHRRAASIIPFVTILLPSKFNLPSISAGYVGRPQLLEILDQALVHRLTLVSAPPGSGKTTTAGAWAQSARKHGTVVCWLSLDESDNNPGRFLDYMNGCLEDGGFELIPGPYPGQEGLQGRLEHLLADFTRSWKNRTREVVIVLDDYHLIQDQQVHRLLVYLLEHLPERLHLMLLTRVDPPLGLARLRVIGQLVELRMEHLRFSDHEAGAFLKKASGVQFAEGELAVLNQRTEGWIAGLKMAALALRRHEDITAFVSRYAGSHRLISDYLLEQVLSRQPPDVKSFLLKTSVLDRFTASLCDEVLETQQSAQTILSQLDRANLFLVPLDDECLWYRYHHLFADFLRLALEQTCPGQSARLRHRASQWYEAQGMLLDSLHHALAAGDMELAARIVSRNVLMLVEQDEVLPALHKIVSARRQDNHTLPWLEIAQAWMLATGQPEKAGQVLDSAAEDIDNLPDAGERRRLHGHLAAVRAHICNSQGDKANAVACARQAIADIPSDEIAVRALTMVIWGDALSLDGYDPEALPILQQAWALALQVEKPHVAMIAAAALVSLHLGVGILRQADQICSDALKIADDYRRRYAVSLSATAGVYSLLARIRSEWGENDQAILYARTGLALSEHWGHADTQVMSLLYLARALTFNGDWEQAWGALQSARETARQISPWMQQMVETFTLESMLDCDPPDAAEIALQAGRVREIGASPSACLRARLLLFEQGDPREVLPILEQGLSDLSDRPSFDLVRLHILRAVAYQVTGNEPQALAVFAQALAIAEPENRIASFVREGAKIESLLQPARAKSLYPSFVLKLLDAFETRRKRQKGPSSASMALIDPLSARELEVLQYLSSHLSTPEIAEKLVVSTNTVRTHIKSIYAKLAAHGRSEAVGEARKIGLLP